MVNTRDEYPVGAFLQRRKELLNPANFQPRLIQFNKRKRRKKIAKMSRKINYWVAKTRKGKHIMSGRSRKR